jgi:hypothetical protein
MRRNNAEITKRIKYSLINFNLVISVQNVMRTNFVMKRATN